MADTTAVINGNEVAVLGGGGVYSFIGYTVTEQSDNTDAETLANIQADKKLALVDNAPTAAGLLAIAAACLSAAGTIDISTKDLRDAVRIRRSVDDMETIFNALVAQR